MRTTTLSTLALPLLFSTLASSITLNCENILVDKKKFNFGKLGGPHVLYVNDESRPPAIHNTTYTIDLCQPLKKVKNIPSADQCPGGTRVCAIEKSYNPVDNTDPQIESVIAIAGDFPTSNGKALDPKYSRLKATDANTEGLRMELHGGAWGRKKQMAVIEFQCDRTRTGNEGFEDMEDKTVSEAVFRKYRMKHSQNVSITEDDEEKPDDIQSLQFISYGASDEKTDVLRLNWRTKYACEDFEEGGDEADGGKKSSSHWGFFTWFIIVVFLGIATYLIFGSWLNYNRYGARGWDLLPHGDTIRDIPYLFKDWSRKVVDTVQGGGSRGGYSAV